MLMDGKIHVMSHEHGQMISMPDVLRQQKPLKQIYHIYLIYWVCHTLKSVKTDIYVIARVQEYRQKHIKDNTIFCHLPQIMQENKGD